MERRISVVVTDCTFRTYFNICFFRDTIELFIEQELLDETPKDRDYKIFNNLLETKNYIINFIERIETVTSISYVYYVVKNNINVFNEFKLTSFKSLCCDFENEAISIEMENKFNALKI
jgi:hypothetical protein